MRGYQDTYLATDGTLFRNSNPEGYASKIETGTVPASLVIELDEVIAANSAITITVDSIPMTIKPWGFSLASGEVAVDRERGLIAFNSSQLAGTISVNYIPAGSRISAGKMPSIFSPGPQGHQGFQGGSGPQGFQGNTGPQGNAGSQGPQGFQGNTGSQGPQGSQPSGAALLASANNFTNGQTITHTNGITLRNSGSSDGFKIQDRPEVPGRQVNFVAMDDSGSGYCVFNAFSVEAEYEDPRTGQFCLFSANPSVSSSQRALVIAINSDDIARISSRIFGVDYGSNPEPPLIIQSGWDRKQIQMADDLGAGQLGFFGTAPVNQPAVDSSASTGDKVDAIMYALQTLGLIQVY